MKKFITSIIFLSILVHGNSQNYDLVVKSNGDSIACYIDSLTDSHIYFEMKHHGHWVKTNMNKNQVIDYKNNAIDKKEFLFLSGTSYILCHQKTKSVYEIRKNSFYTEIGGFGILGSVNFDKIIPVTDKSGIVLGIAIGFLADVVCEINYLYGNSKNFIELGAGYSLPEQLIVPRIGYRYQGYDGFLFRAGGMYFISTTPDSFGDFPWFGLSFGYSF